MQIPLGLAVRQELKLQGKSRTGDQVQLTDWYFMAESFSLTWNLFLNDMLTKECQK